MQSGSKLYHLHVIGYKLQYGSSHNVDTMTFNDVTNHVFNPLVSGTMLIYLIPAQFSTRVAQMSHGKNILPMLLKLPTAHTLE